MLSLEYIAGFFDGEGCVNITLVGKNRQAALRVYITNTDRKILEAIRETVQEGHIYQARNRSTPSHWKRSYMLKFEWHSAERFLRQIAPFVVLKKAQMDLGFDFLDFMSNRSDRLIPRPRPYRGGSMRTTESIARELNFKDRMHDLNRKGVPYAQ